MKYRCACCKCYTFLEEPTGSYEICPVCYWEDDPIQTANPMYEGGANRVSLVQAQANFAKFGACEKEMLLFIKKPKGMT